MDTLEPNPAIWVTLLLLGISVWGNLYPPLITPMALGAATLVSAFSIWLAYKRNSRHTGKGLALPGFVASTFFLGFITLTPVLDSAARHEIDVAGVTRTYRVRIPSSYDGSTPTPVLMVFHGYNQTGYTIERLSRLNDVAERDGFLLVYPEGFERRWRTRRAQRDGVNDIQFVRQMIADLQSSYTVDSAQIFAAGFSNGGSLVLAISCELRDRVRAIVAVAASLRDDHTARCKEESVHPAPAMFINGTADRFVTWERTQNSTRRWAELLRCEPEPTIETLPDRVKDGTRVWRERYDHCADGTEAVLYAIEGAGHTWPNGGYQPRFYFGRTTRDFDSGRVISDFLQRVAKHVDRV